MSTLKQQKEQFVSDLIGGSINEIYLITSIALTSYLSYKLLNNLLKDKLPFQYDFILNVFSILASITYYNNNIKLLHLVIILPILLLFLINSTYLTSTEPKKKKKQQSGKHVEELLPRKSFLTAYRSHMLIITNLAILAVDFKIFPRRFAKVETWGTSLMDLGVGSFVFSMGLVNSRSLIKSYSGNNTYQFNINTYINTIGKNIIKSIPLLILGLIRLISVKQLDYQEHMTEYGIHWNFFITLGLLPIMLALLDPLLQIFPRALIAFGITLAYELLLNKTDLLRFVLVEDNRFNNLVTMNKEGICSFIGYFTIFLFGQSFGSFTLTNYKTKNNLITINKIKVKKGGWLTVSTTTGLIISTIFYQLIFTLVNSSYLFTNISRRIANCPYVLWVVSYNATFLLAYHLIDKIIPSGSNYTSNILESINNNGLLLFLIANLLTGLINMNINTLECNTWISIGILTIYSLIFTIIAIQLNKRRIYIKL